MARPLYIEITETKEELTQYIKKSKYTWEKDRLLMLYYLLENPLISREEMAEALFCSVSTIGYWLSHYRKGGLTRLMTNLPKGGRPSPLTKVAEQGLKAALNQPQGFGSYEEIQRFLKDKFNLELSYFQVWYWVHKKFQAKPKVPRPQSDRARTQAQEVFKKTS